MSTLLKFFKTLLKWIGGFLLLFVLAVSSAFFYLQTDHARDLLLPVINKRIPGTLSYESWQCSLIKGRLQLSNVVLRGPASDSEAPPPAVAAFDHLQASLSWTDLRHGIIRVPSVILSAPVIHLAVNADGRLNLLSALHQTPSGAITDDTPEAAEKPAALPHNLVIEAFQIQNGAFHFTSIPGQLTASATGIQLQAGMNGPAQDGRLELSIPHVTLEGDGYHVDPARLILTAALQNDRLGPIDGLLTTPDSRLALSGRLHPIFDQPEMDMQLDLDAGVADIQNIFSLQGQWSGRLKGRLAAKGPPAEPEADLSLRYSGGKLADYRIEQLQGHLIFQDQQLTVPFLEAMGENIRLKTDGKLNLASSDIAANVILNTNEVQPFMQSLGISDVSGRLKAGAVVSGSLQHPAIKSRLQAANIAYGNYKLETAALKADLDPSGRLDISTLTLSQGQSAFALSGSAQLFKTGTFQLNKTPRGHIKIEESQLQLEDLHPSFTGKIQLNGQLEGNLLRPKGTLSLSGKNLDLGVQKLPAIQLQAASDGKTLTITELSMALSADEWFRINGHVKWDGDYTVDLTSSPIALSSIAALQLPDGTDGKLQLELSGTGSLKSPEIKGSALLSDGRINDKPLEDYTLNVDFQHPELYVSIRQDFDLSGTYNVSRQDFAASLTFKDTALSPWFAIAGLAGLEGIIDGTIETRGNAGKPEGVIVMTDINRLSLLQTQPGHPASSHTVERELLRTAPFTARFTDQIFELPALDMKILGEGSLDVSGKGTLDGPLDFQAKGRLPLTAINGLTEDVTNLQGDVLLAATIDGRMETPRMQGTLEFNDIGMALEVTRQQLRKINGRIRITPDSILLDEIAGHLGAGRFEMGGEMGLDHFQPSHIDISAKAFALPIEMPDMLTAAVNGNLRFQGKPDNARIEGRVNLLEGSYTKDVNLSPLQVLKPSVQREIAPQPSEIHAPFLKNTALDIRIKHRTPFQVDNNVALLDIEPDLHIGGTLNSPVISGRADVTSGTIKYQRNVFTLEKGVIDFINPYRIEPELDILGKSEVRDWNIFLTLTGTPEQLEFKLRSEPEENDEDILSLLLFGKTSRELIKGEGGTGRSAEQMLASFIAETYGEDIKRSMGIDILEVDTTNGTADANNAVQVTLGKELTRRMTVKYAVESSESEMVQRAIAEYKLWEHFMVRSSQDTRGAFDASLVYRLEFR